MVTVGSLVVAGMTGIIEECDVKWDCLRMHEDAEK